MPHKLQAILFDNKKWSDSDAKKWLDGHNYKPIKEFHHTTNFIRVRINPPCKTKPNDYYTVKLPNSIELVYCR